MQKVINRGFTLIELLVVIAIIGILASIVLVSLGNARSRGADAGIQGNLSTIRTQSELVASGANGNYTGVCTDATVSNALSAARSAAGLSNPVNTTLATAGSAGTVTCHSTTGSWAVEAPLASANTTFLCADSTGKIATSSGSTIAASETDCD